MRIFDFLYDIRHEKEGKDPNKDIAKIRQAEYTDPYEYDDKIDMVKIPKERTKFINKLKYAFYNTPINTFEESWLVTKIIKGVWGKITGTPDTSAIAILKNLWADVLNNPKNPKEDYPVERYQYNANNVFAVDNKDIEDENFYYYNSYAEDILMGLYPEDYKE
jgi:hypothetical protein